MDLLPPGEAAELQAWFGEHCAAERTIPISALEGTNTRAVLDWVLAKMPEGPSMYPKVGGPGGLDALRGGLLRRGIHSAAACLLACGSL